MKLHSKEMEKRRFPVVASLDKSADLPKNTKPTTRSGSSYASFGEFLKDVILAEEDLRADQRLEERGLKVPAGNIEERTASGGSEAVPADGGFLLQPEWANQILQRAYQESAVLRRCTQWTLTKNGIKIPAVDETSRQDGSRWGGSRGYLAERSRHADCVEAEIPTDRADDKEGRCSDLSDFGTSRRPRSAGAVPDHDVRQGIGL
jgi:HK97 family phage major capsid protein